MASPIIRTILYPLFVITAQAWVVDALFDVESPFYRKNCSTCNWACNERQCRLDACCNAFDTSSLTDLTLVADCSRPDQSYIQLPNTAATEYAAQQLCGGFRLSVYQQYGCLTALPANLCNFTDIRKITFVGERLAEFPDLSCLPRLVILNLRNNRLTSVPENAFAGLEMLEDVYLDYNQIQSIHHAAFDVNLPQLRVVSVQYNLLTTAEPWPLTIHHGFCIFDVSHNHISRFTNVGQKTVHTSETYGPGHVDVRYNNLTKSPTTYLKTSGIGDVLTFWSKFVRWGFDFRENPFHCDCNFYDILRWLKHLLSFPVIRDYFNITCASPPRFKGVLVVDLPVNELTCVEIENCPQNCICEKRPGKQDTLVNCTGSRLSELPFVLPRAKNLTLNFANNSLVFIPPRKYFRRVNHLDLRGNRIKMIHERVPRNLRKSRLLQTVDLRDNPLRHLPYTFQALRPDVVLLDSESLSCTCDLKWFPVWAQGSASPRYQHTFCLTDNGNKVLLRNATEDDLGCTLETEEPLVYKLSLISIAAVLLVVGVVMAVFRYELLVLSHMLTARVKRRRARNSRGFDNDSEANPPLRHYDVFLCASSESDADMTWIRDTLLPALQRHSLSVYWPARDCDPGKVWLDEVTKNLQDSASALVLLSEHFLDSPASVFQFGQVYDQMVKNSQGRLILLLRGAISRRKITEPRLRAMVNLRMAHSVSQPAHLNKVLGNLSADLHPGRLQTYDNIAFDKY